MQRRSAPLIPPTLPAHVHPLADVETVEQDPSYIFRFPTPPDVGGCPGGCCCGTCKPLLALAAFLAAKLAACLTAFNPLPPGPHLWPLLLLCSLSPHPGLYRCRLWLPRRPHSLPQPQLWVSGWGEGAGAADADVSPCAGWRTAGRERWAPAGCLGCRQRPEPPLPACTPPTIHHDRQ